MGNPFSSCCLKSVDSKFKEDSYPHSKNSFHENNYANSLLRSSASAPIQEEELEIENEKDSLVNYQDFAENAEEAEQTYQRSLKEFMVNTYDFKSKSGEYNHFYQQMISHSNNNSSNLKPTRLTQEIKMLAKNLPLNTTNSIFVLQDQSRMDVFKVVITGAEDTPYAHGFFIFDLFCDDSFPNTPPKCNLMTTGKGKIRFNPNLYTSGYVCLSLLGTWSGDAIEKWNSASNLLQIFISIQAIVMSEGVIYNEPGHQQDCKTSSGVSRNLGYCNIVKLSTIKHAIRELIEEPPAGFEKLIKNYFFHKKKKILRTCYKWIDEERKNCKNALYDGLVEIHNRDLAIRYKMAPKLFLQDLKKEVEALRKTLDKIEIQL